MRVLVLSMIAVTGCGSFTHFQSAQSLEAGKFSFDFQTASIAMNEGLHLAARGRAGLGKGFEVGVETDIFSLMLLENFQSPGEFGLILGDLKWQFLEESDRMPVSAALGFGGGSGSLTDFHFGQVTFSRAFGFAEPYLAYRYQRFRVDMDLDDIDDVEDLEDSYLAAIFEQVNDTRFGLNHLFVGIKLMVSDTMFIVPEVSWIFGEAEGTGSIGLAFGFQSPPTPPERDHVK